MGIERFDPTIPQAATLLLLRDGAAGIEVLMITRNAKSSFAAGALVFPGGRLDESDATFSRHCRDADSCGPAELALRVTAIRETYEEAHVLLARQAGGTTLLTAAEVKALEQRVEAQLGRLPRFADLLAGGGLELATDLLVRFAHWVTPAGWSKRYDTHFFLAPAPADQEPRHDGREAVAAAWIGALEAVARGEQKRVRLVFATRLSLQKLGRSATVAEAFASAQREPIVAVCPVYVETADGAKFTIPLSAGYGITELPAHRVTLA
jgi:8-oxo-dGTP pyrophosphatase MutT (NUDIX family)